MMNQKAWRLSPHLALALGLLISAP
ncbi:uncharacterized protein METZ01_LOCUS118602, partial [marine metagenome]